MKRYHIIIFLLTLQFALETKAFTPNITVLIDENLDYSNTKLYPQNCDALNCPICCGGIPPACSENKLACNLNE